MSRKSTWSGVALLGGGLIFLYATNTGGRSSKLGLIVSGLMMLLGVMRMMGGRGETPPA
jgi:hypothetical protein